MQKESGRVLWVSIRPFFCGLSRRSPLVVNGIRLERGIVEHVDVAGHPARQVQNAADDGVPDERQDDEDEHRTRHGRRRLRHRPVEVAGGHPEHDADDDHRQDLQTRAAERPAGHPQGREGRRDERQRHRGGVREVRNQPVGDVAGASGASHGKQQERQNELHNNSSLSRM